MPYLLYFLVLTSIQLSHDYHFGYGEIYYNKENKSLETSIKLFTDDLDKAVSKGKSFKLNLNTEEELSNSDGYIEEYILKNVAISINKKDIEINYLGKEYEDDIIWIYLEASKVKKIKDFKIKNTLLFDTFKDQKHLLNINIDKKTKSALLEKGHSKYQLSLE